jgi:hypothetical protein
MSDNKNEIVSRVERLVRQIHECSAQLSAQQRAEVALGFFLASCEALGYKQERIHVEIRKAFAARDLRRGGAFSAQESDRVPPPGSVKS